MHWILALFIHIPLKTLLAKLSLLTESTIGRYLQTLFALT